MNRNEVIALIKEEARAVEPGQKYELDRFRPEDGMGVARLYYSVYGDAYPVDTPYAPDLLAAANRDDEILTSVARAESGDVLGQAALYRSSPPNRRLYEYGQVLVRSEYRHTRLALRLHQHAMASLVDNPLIDGFYGEAVCNHVFTQKLISRNGCFETGLEPALMPDGAYKGEGADGRVSCLMAFRVDRDERRKLFLPPCWREEIAFLMEGGNLDREVLPSEEPIPDDAATDVAARRFEAAGVVRVNVAGAGPDAVRRVAEAEAGNPALVQVFLNLGQPWAGRVAEALRERGYFLCGFLPIWFGTDGLLLQKLSVPPDFEAMLLHSERARRIQELVRADWERSLRAGAPAGPR